MLLPPLIRDTVICPNRVLNVYQMDLHGSVGCAIFSKIFVIVIYILGIKKWQLPLDYPKLQVKNPSQNKQKLDITTW